MRHASESGARRLPRRILVLTTASALVLSGCVSPAFRESVGQFGTLTKAAVTSHDRRLAALRTNEDERIRAQLAAERADLRVDPACYGLLAQDIATPAPQEGAPPPPTPPAPNCSLVRQGGGAIEQPPEFQNILALGAALSKYSDNLIALAADPTADAKAFETSVTGLATSVAGLDSALRNLVGAKATDFGPKLNSIATVVAQLGSLYLTHRRNRVLKRIIIEADPIVQEAVLLLSGADTRLGLYERTRLARLLDEAQTRASDALRRPNEIRPAQDRLFQALAAYNQYGRDVPNFRAIGEAHRRLRTAAETGSSVDLQAAIEAIIRLAGTTHSTITTLSNGSGNNGN